MKTVVVIGGSGFLGKHLLMELMGKNYRVIAVSHKNPLPHHHEIQVFTGGIKTINHELIDRILPDIIFHVARPTLPALKRWGRRITSYRATILNRFLLRQLLSSKSRPKLVFASGSLAYGNSAMAHDENSPLRPISYARQYLNGEMPFVKAANAKSYPLCLVRLPWLLGYGSWFTWFYLNNISRHRAIPLFGQGDNMMNILDVKDAARLIIAIGNQKQLHPVRNIFSPYGRTQREFATLISETFNCEIRKYQSFYGHRTERELLEAFQSNILLKTQYPEILDAYNFIPISETLAGIKSEYPAH